MQTTAFKPLTLAIMASTAVGLAGCFSGSSSSESTGSLSLDVTDAPVDSLDKVQVSFTGVTLKPRDGDRVEIELEDEITVDMLELQEGNAANLFSDEEVPAGEYNWILLELNQDNMFVVESDTGGEVDLRVPSGDQQGLRLVSGFTVPQGGEANFTIDFDLRAAITDPQGQDVYFLRPALRLVDNTEVGAIAGTVFPELISDACADESGQEYAGAVYVYEGMGVEPFDYSDEQSPLMSAAVNYDEDADEHNYRAAFLAEGDYTIAYTCDSDDPEAEEALDFRGTRDVSVEANETQTENFELENAE